MSITKTLRPALVLFSALTVLTGMVYPLMVNTAGQLAFPQQAGGSLVLKDGKPVGSSLIGQSFSKPDEFWSRPSATGAQPYNAAASGGSNYGPNHPDLHKAVAERLAVLREADPLHRQSIPVDLVTASASGLDPHISLAAAYYQVERVAQVRRLDPVAVHKLVEQQAETPWWGETKVNVLALNLALTHYADQPTRLQPEANSTLR